MTVKLIKLQEETPKMRGGGGNALALSVLPLQERTEKLSALLLRGMEHDSDVTQELNACTK